MENDLRRLEARVKEVEKEMEQTQQWWTGRERDEIMSGHEVELKELNSKIEKIKEKL
ncbi:hypothetical protein [Shimazuella kribbensis]|uniref:hypothetical protein n=1 Tax=Shimazuella kribbensis TaxID=139808 RepID=UPI0004070039|nr:hypothetical protein [Shimazuella kribbensis]